AEDGIRDDLVTGVQTCALPICVVLPLALPGIQSGAILVFVLAVSAYVTPVLIGGMRIKTMAVIVVETLIDQFQWPLGSALALILSATATLAVVLFMRLTRIRWK